MSISQNNPLLIAMVVSVSLLAGCGGGGSGGGGSVSNPTTLVVTGTVTNSSGVPINNAEVVDTTSNVTVYTNSSGVFSLTLPAAESETTNTFDFYDASGNLQLVQQKSINVNAGGTLTYGTVSLGPPPPPITPG